MHFLLNALIALLVGFLADYILARCGVSDPIKVIIAVIIGVLVYIANPAGYF